MVSALASDCPAAARPGAPAEAVEPDAPPAGDGLEEAAASNFPLRRAYGRKVAQVRFAPCAHIVATIPLDRATWEGAAGIFEHHAVLDTSAKEVIHYWQDNADQQKCVKVEPLAAFEREFRAWRVVELPASEEHARVVLDRARSKVGELRYSLVTNNCEHFATWCFEGWAQSRQVWSLGANVATSAKGGVVAGLAAASATTTVTTPWYFLGLIPWGATTATVPAMSTAAAVGVGLGAFVGWVGLGLGASYGLHRWKESRSSELAQYVPVGVFNCSDEEVLVQVQNLDASSTLYPPSVDDLVHDARAYCGVGQRRLALGSGFAGELNPPAEDALFHSFTLQVLVKGGASSTWASWLRSSYAQVAECEVQRGDVLLYRARQLEQVPDPGEDGCAGAGQ